MSKANIGETGACRSECEVTYHHNSAHPEIETLGRQGDVRKCEHGNVWLFVEEFTSKYFSSMDRWRRLHPFWNRCQYKRAIRAIEIMSEGQL